MEIANNFSERFQENQNDTSSDYDFDEENPVLPEEEELQRTDFWRMIRNGCWTASMIKTLMACNNKGGKMCWSNPAKVFEFSSGSLKAIYEVAKSRQRGYWIETETGKSAKYGTKVEPLVFEIAKEYFLEKGLDVQRIGFVKLPTIPTAGVSSDLLVYDQRKKLKIYNGEQKACVTWGSHYDRTFDLLDEKGMDFWQVQMQMIAQETEESVYIISEPPSNINKYLYCDEIMDLLEDFRKECAISYEFVKASPIHQKALLARIEIAENTVIRWLKEGGSLKEILYEEIDAKKDLMKEDMVFVSPKKIEEIEVKEEEQVTFIFDIPENNLVTSDLAKDLDVTFEMVSVEEVDFNVPQKIEEEIEIITDLENLPKDFPF